MTLLTHAVHSPIDAFTLAHLSDPHLTTLAGTRARALLGKRTLGYLSWRRRRRFVHDRRVLAAVIADMKAEPVDHVVVTGDLTHVGLPEECGEARAWLDALGDPESVTVVPGNHDRYAGDGWHETVGCWAPFMRGDDLLEGNGAAHSDGSFPVVRVRGPVAVIGLNTAVPTPLFFATGRVGARQRERLAAVLENLGARGFFRIVALHHSPLTDGHGWRKRLTDSAAVLGVLTERGAELVVHGHGHHERLEAVPNARGTMLIVAAPSASLRGDRRAGWNRYRIAGGPGEWRVSVEPRRWSPDRGVGPAAASTHVIG